MPSGVYVRNPNNYPLKEILIECQYCHKFFKTKNKTRKYCSCLCAGKVKRKIIDNEIISVECQYCYKLFETFNKTRKYCSRSCIGKIKSQSMKSKTFSIECQYCHKLFEVRWNIQSKTRKYCSRFCFRKSQWENPEYRQKRSQSLKNRIYSVEHKLRISKSHIGLLKNEKSHFWKGGITPIRLQIRNSFKYKEWRLQCFKRDNFTCQKCGQNEYQKDNPLNVHHKKQFSKLLQEAKKYSSSLLSLYNACMIYPPFWNLNNGITLCKKCHTKMKHKFI